MQTVIPQAVSRTQTLAFRWHLTAAAAKSRPFTLKAQTRTSVQTDAVVTVLVNCPDNSSYITAWGLADKCSCI